MSDKFHINSKNESQPCKASVRTCRFGDSSHFDNWSDAKVESERRLKSELGDVPKANKKKAGLAKGRADRSAPKAKVASPRTETKKAAPKLDQTLIRDNAGMNSGRIRLHAEPTEAEISRLVQILEPKLQNRQNSRGGLNQIRMDGADGNASGVNLISYNKNTEMYEFGKARFQMYYKEFESKDLRTTIVRAAEVAGFDDEDYNPRDWDE